MLGQSDHGSDEDADKEDKLSGHLSGIGESL